MPIIQFSIPPWKFGDECAEICAQYAHLHGKLNHRQRSLIEQQVPIVRPVWWIAPADEVSLTCDDEYLIGNSLLVAPVISEGARARDVYLPAGTWRSYWNLNELHEGGWLRNYPAPLDVLPLFERLSE